MILAFQQEFFIVGLPAEIDAKISFSLLYKSYNYMNQKIKQLFYQPMNKQNLKCGKNFLKKIGYNRNSSICLQESLVMAEIVQPISLSTTFFHL